MSTRLEFRVADLRKRVEKSHTAAVAAADAQLAHENNLTERIAEWRAEQERRVRSLASQMRKGNVSDQVLSEFRIKSIPSKGYGNAEERHKSAVEEADNRRDRALDRLNAVRSYTPEGETEPVLSLTPGMASDWFGI